ncbi:transcription factor [Schizosaccharomyces octosporus yFS286]|uniref:Transcription factor n=1 Tax=Schizosaccharomyces octosporus (strain yFS286) TaxID=483514 RepID=S9PZH1_SCHOY|nr:transcription factor [Schizosaccharomyces octosporus yFS286]EPX74461.1 transcription factor [Schizosaccharomyces octosporus yFS286]
MPASSTLKIRRRTPKSCLNCRRRKLKCDRQHPCSRCKERSERCVYAEGSEIEDGSPEANDQLQRTVTREAVNSATNVNKKPPEVFEITQKKFEFYGWKTFLELIGRKKQDHKTANQIYLMGRNIRLSVALPEDILSLFPPYFVSKALVQRFLDTTNELFPIFYRSEIENFLMSIQAFGLDSISSDGILLLLCIIGHVLEVTDPPLEAKEDFASVDCNPVDLSDLIRKKLDEIFFSFDNCQGSVGNLTRVQYCIVQALYNLQKQIKGFNVALCHCINLSTRVSPIYQLDTVANEVNTDLWLTICEIDAMEHIFKSKNSWVQRDVFGRLQPRRDFFSDEKTFQYHSLLGKLLNCGLDIQKAVHTLTIQEYLQKLDEFDVNLSLILTSIESLFFGVNDTANTCRYDFLRLIFWTIRKNLYQCFLTVEHDNLPELNQIFEKLTIACLQACRIATGSSESFIRFDLLRIASLESITCLLIISFCQERGFKLPDNCIEVVYDVKHLNSIVDKEDHTSEGFEFVFDFILSTLESYPSKPPDMESEHFLEDPLRVFSDLFSIQSHFFFPH